MKRLALISLIACVVSLLTVQAQSRRVAPGKAKPNERPADAAPLGTPTPAPVQVSNVADDPNAVDSGDIQSVDTRLVTLPVRVIDRKNRFVGGLKQASFKVFEDNVEQEIAYFTNEAQPFTVALVLDMSYSTTFKIGEIQSAAISFIDQLRPEDKVIVISFDEDVHMPSIRLVPSRPLRRTGHPTMSPRTHRPAREPPTVQDTCPALS